MGVLRLDMACVAHGAVTRAEGELVDLKAVQEGASTVQGREKPSNERT